MEDNCKNSSNSSKVNDNEDTNLNNDSEKLKNQNNNNDLGEFLSFLWLSIFDFCPFIANFFPDFRQNNPFSFKHFLKSDSLGGNGNSSSSNNNNNNINHSQSTSNIGNGNCSESLTAVNGNTSSPAKSATTSSLHNSSLTGTRPKIPQFQSVNLINNVESKMKRSPRFSSFDSQSSLSELTDGVNMQSSKSNNSFNLDSYNYPSPSSINPKSSQNVQRSYSHYQDLQSHDIESPLDESTSILDRKPFPLRNYSRQNQSSNGTTSNTVLPDFVQDHLIMEWYNTNNNDSPSKSSSDFENLNEFQINGTDDEPSSSTRSFGGDIPFDLTFNQNQETPSQTRNRIQNSRRNFSLIPLDLPSIHQISQAINPQDQPAVRPSTIDLPPDLTNSKNTNSSNANSHHHNGHHNDQAYGSHNGPEITREQASIDKLQSLPDFLSDGPIIIRLQQENDRLRQELEERRCAMVEQATRITDLEKEISNAKNLETEYNLTLAKSMEQVEENLNASNVSRFLGFLWNVDF